MDSDDPCQEAQASEAVQENSYVASSKYWEHVDPTVDGMLGGFGNISNLDIQGSQNFLTTVYQLLVKPGRQRAVDCGAGIGRITFSFLNKVFPVVDLVEQNKTFLEEAQKQLSATSHKGQFFNVGLQDFHPEREVYDVIWVQWVLLYLQDEDLVAFFQRCRLALKPSGVIIVKENIAHGETDEIDVSDASVTRSMSSFKTLFNKAGLKIIKDKKQPRFPKELYDVYMFALRPDFAPRTIS
uniref:Alpha N-terminal protein methyltransferase 1 n=1 Tax=Lynceus sp. MCZ IZ 141354 TaxID=1930659 RepID=A0A9N6WYY4_9CRUS|nr:EOG090X0EJQ [Lynceus sp. MCZ IZ 141354]